MIKLSLYDVVNRLELRLQGIKSVGFFQPSGWTEPVEFFLFDCKKHGIQLSYAQGHDEELKCNECFYEDLRDDLKQKYPRLNHPKIPPRDPKTINTLAEET